MSFVRKTWRASRIALFALAGWLMIHDAALAVQPAKPNPSETINSNVYVLAYILVILGIALGMLFVCRPSNRRDRAKPEQFGETKSLKKEDE
jgi:heme/copper-type cytochrome/quinol oxidase subunit 2